MGHGFAPSFMTSMRALAAAAAVAVVSSSCTINAPVQPPAPSDKPGVNDGKEQNQGSGIKPPISSPAVKPPVSPVAPVVTSSPQPSAAPGSGASGSSSGSIVPPSGSSSGSTSSGSGASGSTSSGSSGSTSSGSTDPNGGSVTISAGTDPSSGSSTSTGSTSTANPPSMAQEGSNIKVQDMVFTVPAGWSLIQDATSDDTIILGFASGDAYTTVYVKKSASESMDSLFKNGSTVSYADDNKIFGKYTWKVIDASKRTGSKDNFISGFMLQQNGYTYFGYSSGANKDTVKKTAETILNSAS